MDSFIISPDNGIMLAAVALGIVISALSSTVLYRLSPFHPLAKYPGPFLWRITSLYLSYISATGKRHLIFDELHKKYGSYVRIGPNFLSVNTRSGLMIYGTQLHMEKSDAYVTPGHLPDVALFFKQNKAAHSNRKRIWATAFTNSSISHFIPPLESRTWQLVECIQRRTNLQGIVDMTECVAHFAYDFMGEMVFGGSNNLELMREGDPEQLLEGLKLAAIALDSFGQSPWLMDIAWHMPFGQSMQRIRYRAIDMMRKRVKAAKEVEIQDLASHLLAGDPQTGEQIPQGDLDLDAVVAIQGGSDNIATILALALYFITAQPHYYQYLRAELDQVVSGSIGDLDIKVLSELPLLNGIINETLRLGSPFFLPRVVPAEGAAIGTEVLPGGTIVAFAAYSQQTSPDNFYPEPMTFRPERWLPGGLGEGTITQRAVLAAFSFGPYACVAKNFAYHQMRYVLSRLVLTLDMSLPVNFDGRGFEDGFLNMRTNVLDKPLMMQVSRREGVNISKLL
ncbi:hypothetical protein M422DRAFT_58037 [Sphaerobolus stellatus SS14]|nr:hypothetical protein M422DRAFT_58037 [Sphaerobolus stellatus SS14]